MKRADGVEVRGEIEEQASGRVAKRASLVNAGGAVTGAVSGALRSCSTARAKAALH